MTKDKFKDKIWITKTSRINAEKRLIKKEKFFQIINIYYSCITIFLSIVSLLKHNETLSLMTVFMSITLFTVILYLNSQKYLENAREYRKNYTQLHYLEFELESVEEQDIDKMLKLEKKYCELLDSSSNHESYDYYCTLHGSDGKSREEHWGTVKRKFYFIIVGRVLIVVTLVILPAILYKVCEVVN